MKKWFLYMLRCSDGTFYTGITTDLERRVSEHNGLAVGKGAKYTQVRRPVELVYFEKAKDRSDASIKEYQLKNLSRKEKEKLVDKNQ